MKKLIFLLFLLCLTLSLSLFKSIKVDKDKMFYSEAKWLNEKDMMLTRSFIKLYKNGKFKYAHTIEVKDTNVRQMFTKIDYLIPRVETGKYTIEDSVFIGKCNNYFFCQGKKKCDFTNEYRIDFKKKPLVLYMIGYEKKKFKADDYVFIKEFM